MAASSNIGSQIALRVATHPIWAERGRAIQAYAILEQVLCELLAELSGMKKRAAPIIFFKITSKRAIRDIFEKLIRLRFEGTYNIFWNSYLRHLQDIDNTRNHIVHWIVQNEHTQQADEILDFKITLIQPNLYTDPGAVVNITVQDMLDFSDKCSTLSALCRAFIQHACWPSGRGPQPPWSDIFQQAIIYPLPSGHPLIRSHKKQQSQPPPSPE